MLNTTGAEEVWMLHRSIFFFFTAHSGHILPFFFPSPARLPYTKDSIEAFPWKPQSHVPRTNVTATAPKRRIFKKIKRKKRWLACDQTAELFLDFCSLSFGVTENGSEPGAANETSQMVSDTLLCWIRTFCLYLSLHSSVRSPTPQLSVCALFLLPSSSLSKRPPPLFLSLSSSHLKPWIFSRASFVSRLLNEDVRGDSCQSLGQIKNWPGKVCVRDFMEVEGQREIC